MNTTKKKIERCVIMWSKTREWRCCSFQVSYFVFIRSNTCEYLELLFYSPLVCYFSFPKNKYHEWKTYCLEINSDKIIFSSSKLCCIHFSPDCFSSVSPRHILKKNAIPSLNPKNQGSNVRLVLVCLYKLDFKRASIKQNNLIYLMYSGDATIIFHNRGPNWKQ